MRYYIGVDWADEEHAVWVEDEQGQRVSAGMVRHSPVGLSEWGRQLDEWRAQGIVLWAAIERPEGRVVDCLLDHVIALRDAQQKALAELQSTESRANAVPPVLRPSFLPQLKQARQKYVDSQLKILDFLDERDRGIVARLQEEIGRFNRELEGRQKSRDELKKLLSE